MEIQVRKSNSLKKYSGDFVYDYTPPEGSCLVPLCAIAGTVKVEGSFEIYEDGGVGVNLTVRYRIEGQCSYCLEPAAADIEFNYDVLFLTRDDGENYVYDGIRVDLKPAVDDAILFSQPNVVLCREGCTGIEINNK